MWVGCLKIYQTSKQRYPMQPLKMKQLYLLILMAAKIYKRKKYRKECKAYTHTHVCTHTLIYKCIEFSGKYLGNWHSGVGSREGSWGAIGW